MKMSLPHLWKIYRENPYIAACGGRHCEDQGGGLCGRPEGRNQTVVVLLLETDKYSPVCLTTSSHPDHPVVGFSFGQCRFVLGCLRISILGGPTSL